MRINASLAHQQTGKTRPIGRLAAAIERIREYNPDFAMSQLALFLYVAQNPGVTMHEINQLLGVPQGSISRNIKELGTYVEYENGVRKTKGYGLVRREPHIEERRRLALYLTKEGEQLARELEDILTMG